MPCNVVVVLMSLVNLYEDHTSIIATLRILINSKFHFITEGKSPTARIMNTQTASARHYDFHDIGSPKVLAQYRSYRVIT